jgi:hypothetical protein
MDRLVIARCFGGVARVCRVLRVIGDTVYVTDSIGFNEFMRDGDTPRQTGFHTFDVFRHVDSVLDFDTPDWATLSGIDMPKPL